ncbi:hypothetical protein MHYP_G00168510 [Metynnis hypsauchen]
MERTEERAADRLKFGYETPPTCELLDLLLKSRRPSGPFDEVWPNIIISDARTAKDVELLKVLGVTHVVNAADGPSRIHTGSTFYSHAHIQIQYYGVEAPDSRDFNISRFFYPTAHFIHSALSLSSACTQSRVSRLKQSNPACTSAPSRDVEQEESKVPREIRVSPIKLVVSQR